jgi:hypothetical protein
VLTVTVELAELPRVTEGGVDAGGVATVYTDAVTVTVEVPVAVAKAESPP